MLTCGWAQPSIELCGKRLRLKLQQCQGREQGDQETCLLELEHV